MPVLNKTSAATLNHLIGTPECPELIDVCVDTDFLEDPYLIPGSRRHSHDDLAGLERRLSPDTHTVFICQKGKKLSQGVTAWWTAKGGYASYLEGGVQGWDTVPNSGRIPFTALPAAADNETLWVTDSSRRISQLAAAWLIRRFIDNKARILFVSPSEVDGVAEHFGAMPFCTHTDSEAHASLDLMLETFQLTSFALKRIAKIVRAIDRPNAGSDTTAPGLRVLFDGLSRQFCNHNEELQVALTIFDALYRAARDGSVPEQSLANPGGM